MNIYFSDNNMLGRDYVANFYSNGNKYATLREFIGQNGLDFDLLKQAVLDRLNCNKEIYDYFLNCSAEFYHVKSETFHNLNCRKNYIITKSDCYHDNLLGVVYNTLQPANTFRKERILDTIDNFPTSHVRGKIARMIGSCYMSCHYYY